MKTMEKTEQEITNKQRQNKDKRLANLRPIKKGEVRNPNGRPKKVISLTSEMKAQLEEVCPYDPKLTWLKYLVKRWLELATEKSEYFRELMDRAEGKVTIPIEGNINAEVTFTIGKGYGEGKSTIQPDKLNTGQLPQLEGPKGAIQRSVRSGQDNSAVQQGVKAES